MANSFTPGPWVVGLGTLSTVASQVRHYGKDGAFYIVADCHTGFGGLQTRESNAQLIAAAPELLDALTTALPYVETAEDDPAYKPGAVAKVVKQMRAVIAKATGEKE